LGRAKISIKYQREIMSVLPLKRGYNRFFGAKKGDMGRKACVQVLNTDCGNNKVAVRAGRKS